MTTKQNTTQCEGMRHGPPLSDLSVSGVSSPLEEVWLPIQRLLVAGASLPIGEGIEACPFNGPKGLDDYEPRWKTLFDVPPGLSLRSAWAGGLQPSVYDPPLGRDPPRPMGLHPVPGRSELPVLQKGAKANAAARLRFEASQQLLDKDAHRRTPFHLRGEGLSKYRIGHQTEVFPLGKNLGQGVGFGRSPVPSRLASTTPFGLWNMLFQLSRLGTPRWRPAQSRPSDQGTSGLLATASGLRRAPRGSRLSCAIASSLTPHLSPSGRVTNPRWDEVKWSGGKRARRRPSQRRASAVS